MRKRPDPARTLNRAAMTMALRDACASIEGLIEEINQGEHNDSGPMALGYCFQPALWNLCIAWHSRWLTDDELRGLTTEEDDDMRDSIPNWGLQFRLVDIDEPARFNPPDAPV